MSYYNSENIKVGDFVKRTTGDINKVVEIVRYNDSSSDTLVKLESDDPSLQGFITYKDDLTHPIRYDLIILGKWDSYRGHFDRYTRQGWKAQIEGTMIPTKIAEDSLPEPVNLMQSMALSEGQIETLGDEEFRFKALINASGEKLIVGYDHDSIITQSSYEDEPVYMSVYEAEAYAAAILSAVEEFKQENN